MPDYQTLMLPLMRRLTAEPQRLADLVPVLADEFELTPEERASTLKDGRSGLFYNRVHWARTYLGKAGLVESPRRGWHRLTAQGRRVLAEGHARVDISVLDREAGFRTWRTSRAGQPDNVSGPGSGWQASGPSSVEVSDKTPEEILAGAHAELTAGLADDLLQAVLALHPVRFEQLILDLLNAMGYGGGHLDKGKLTARSGDGGIDGVVSEDVLGLDAVYVQAKCYALDNSVGRPALQQFIGSLQGEGASKGAFVTTSSFTRDAVNYVQRVQPRVVLIDGSRLTAFMIRHGVGLRERTRFVVQTIDEDYFSDLLG